MHQLCFQNQISCSAQIQSTSQKKGDILIYFNNFRLKGKLLDLRLKLLFVQILLGDREKVALEKNTRSLSLQTMFTLNWRHSVFIC